MAPRLSCMVYLYIFADQRDWVESIGWESSSALGYLKRSLGIILKDAVGTFSY